MASAEVSPNPYIYTQNHVCHIWYNTSIPTLTNSIFYTFYLLISFYYDVICNPYESKLYYNRVLSFFNYYVYVLHCQFEENNVFIKNPTLILRWFYMEIREKFERVFNELLFQWNYSNLTYLFPTFGPHSCLEFSSHPTFQLQSKGLFAIPDQVLFSFIFKPIILST